ncbi:MAG: hypothetical protein H0W72_05070 [Planctomycetes bacterium]|nr:hypothetical protein [Planctomycetota bacterium]
MTLFEVGISLLIVSVTVITVLMLFPVGLKAEQESRYRIVAAAQAQKLVQGMLERQQHVTFASEGAEEGDQPYTSPTVLAPDLDGGINLRRGGIDWATWSGFAPLPPEILARIDSDHDELARIAAGGGPVFYAFNDSPDMKLVFAVSGHPQQNALLYHPQIKWPYHDFYPSGFIPSGSIPGPTGPVPGGRGIEDTEVRVLWSVDNTLALYAEATSNDRARMRGALKTLGIDFDVVSLPVPSQSALDAQYYLDPMRFNARGIVLRYYAYACGVDATRSGMAQYWPNPVYPDSVAEIADFQIAHAWMLAYIGYLQLRQPYDLCTPRNYAMATLCDAPLFQFDLTAALRDPGAGNGLMHAWRVLSSRPIASVGANTFGDYNAWTPIAPGYDVWAGGSTRLEATGWNLSAPFAAGERCRAIVAWAVDWQSWEDFESLPGSSPDSGVLPMMPRSNNGTNWAGGSPGTVAGYWATDSFHPEFPYAWKRRDRQATVLQECALPHQNYCRGAADQNTLPSYLIRHGADRNRNGVFDRGPARSSTRLRATTIARFLAYDPRLYLQLR